MNWKALGNMMATTLLSAALGVLLKWLTDAQHADAGSTAASGGLAGAIGLINLLRQNPTKMG